MSQLDGSSKGHFTLLLSKVQKRYTKTLKLCRYLDKYARILNATKSQN